jgi:hypothetical protein
MRTIAVIASLALSTVLRAQAACSSLQWAPPLVINESANIKERASTPRIAVGTRDGFIIANEQQLNDAGPPTTFSLAMWRFASHGPSVASPKFVQGTSPNGNSFHWPEPIVTADGALHVVWGDDPVVEPGIDAHQLQLNVWRGNFTGLWHISYQHGKWSKPEKIAQADELVWNSTSHAIPVTTADGGFVVAAPAVARSSNAYSGRLLVARWRHEQWAVSMVPIHQVMPPAYVTIASQSKTLILGYIAPAAGGAADENSVFVVRSFDNGVTWGDPILVRRSGANPAYMLQLLALKDGSLGLVWNQAENHSIDASILSYVRSTDDGLTWSKPIQLAEPQQGDMRATIDRCGRIIATFERGTLPHMVMQTAYVDGSRWSPAMTLSPNRTSVSPAITEDATGCVHAVWNSIDPDSLRASSVGLTSPRITYSFACPSPSKSRAVP